MQLNTIAYINRLPSELISVFWVMNLFSDSKSNYFEQTESNISRFNFAFDDFSSGGGTKTNKIKKENTSTDVGMDGKIAFPASTSFGNLCILILNM